MLFPTRPTRTTQTVQPTAVAFAAFTAEHPQLHLDTVHMRAGTVTVHLHGPHALVHLAHWEEALGDCARSSDSFPSSCGSRLHYTECRTAVVAGTSFEAVAFYDGPGAYDPHRMIRPGLAAIAPAALINETATARVPARPASPIRRCAATLGVTTALAVAAITAAAIRQRGMPLRLVRTPVNR
ncbi:hypothetical protein [[Kitasatospora] papulosa]|uniref:hypothetical protein n=1 Tax=[Kitasatospora] papulosa TaxID=1464011 RepID=UPI003642B72E